MIHHQPRNRLIASGVGVNVKPVAASGTFFPHTAARMYTASCPMP
jgi:hypothetical protein